MLQQLIDFVTIRNPRKRRASELATLEWLAEDAAEDFQAQLFHRAGTLCARAGDRSRALVYYGRAIDARLRLGHYDVAGSMCRKIIEIEPEVVRARCTLAFLSLGRSLLPFPFDSAADDIEGEIRAYVGAARKRGQEAFAANGLHLMAEATGEDEIRELIGESLLELGDSATADQVFGSIYRERNQLQERSSLEEQRTRWAEALQIPLVHVPRKRAAPQPPERRGRAR